MVQCPTILSFVIVVLANTVALACPTCKDSATSNATASTPIFNGSILYMLGSIAVIGGFTTMMIVKEVRSQRPR